MGKAGRMLSNWSVEWKAGLVLMVLCGLILGIRVLGIGQRFRDASDWRIGMEINLAQRMRTVARLRLLQSNVPAEWREEVDPWGTVMRFAVTAKSCTVYSAGADREWGTDDDVQVSVP